MLKKNCFKKIQKDKKNHRCTYRTINETCTWGYK